ncbi:MAG: hypothetical protein ACLVBP_09595 [Ruminococcus sp.]
MQIAGMIFQTGSRALGQTGSGFQQDRSSWYSLDGHWLHFRVEEMYRTEIVESVCLW